MSAAEIQGFPGTVGRVETQLLRIDLPEGGLCLEYGQRLPELVVAYERYGELSPRRDNVIFICHALSGHAHVAGYHEPVDADGSEAWWDEMVGPGKGIDTRYYQVICANVLGGCKGTTGPASIDPRTGRPYGSSFPDVTVGDIVEVHRLLLKALGIERLACVLGGSFGGMQALEWTLRYPGMIARSICIASAAALSAQALAFDVVGRKAIMFDPDWRGGDYYVEGLRGPWRGLALARKIGHITYLSREMMTSKFGRERWVAGTEPPAGVGRPVGGAPSRFPKFHVETYLEHQGEKFTRRFDANSYLCITRAMDEYDLTAKFGTLEQAFGGIGGKMLAVALSSDWLFPPEQSKAIASALLRAGKAVSYCQLTAPHGHDGFLVDIENLGDVIRAFLPWVGEAPRPAVAAGRKVAGVGRSSRPRRRDFELICDMVSPGARVLDLGSGNGELLSMLGERRGVRGTGVDIDMEHLIEVIDRGHDIFQADIDGGLAMIPDGAFDYAVLSETLAMVRRPRLVLQEMLRVAREGIVGFSNFGYWRHRVGLAVSGRIPRGLGEAGDGGPLQLLTLRDFTEVCHAAGMVVLEAVCVSRRRGNGLFRRLGWPNLGAEYLLVRVTRGEPRLQGAYPCRWVKDGGGTQV